MAMSFELVGFDKMTRQLQDLALKFAHRVEPALRAEAEIEMAEAKRRTPVATGALRASGHVEVTVSGRDAEARLRFGGPSAPYSVFVHENLRAYHRVGQAKFLESTLMESKRFMAARLARRIASGT